MLPSWLVLALAVPVFALGAVDAPTSRVESRRPRLHLSVEVNPSVDATGLDMSRVLGDVVTTWRPYLNIDVVDSVGTDDRSGPVERARVLTVRFTERDRPAANRETVTVGWIEFVDAEPTSVLNISLAAADSWAARGRVAGQSLSTLPYRARRPLVHRTVAQSIAHEIGHFVLRSTRHATHGLMQANLRVNQLTTRPAGSAAWRLTRAEERLLAERMLAPVWTQVSPTPTACRRRPVE